MLARAINFEIYLIVLIRTQDKATFNSDIVIHSCQKYTTVVHWWAGQPSFKKTTTIRDVLWSSALLRLLEQAIKCLHVQSGSMGFEFCLHPLLKTFFDKVEFGDPFLYCTQQFVAPVCVNVYKHKGQICSPVFTTPLQGKTLQHMVVLCRYETGAWLHGPWSIDFDSFTDVQCLAWKICIFLFLETIVAATTKRTYVHTDTLNWVRRCTLTPQAGLWLGLPCGTVLSGSDVIYCLFFYFHHEMFSE